MEDILRRPTRLSLGEIAEAVRKSRGIGHAAVAGPCRRRMTVDSSTD
jgi:hypothetical protein